MANTLSDFKTNLKGGGARANLFKVDLTFPGSSGLKMPTEFEFLCKASNFPASNIASIDVPFRGRTFKVAGDRTYDPWSITVINDSGFEIRKVFENWMQIIGQYEDASGKPNPGDYMGTATVTQLKRKGIDGVGTKALGQDLDKDAQYKFHDIFPTSISAIDLSYDSADTIEEFTVEFQIQYWTPFG